MVYSHIKRPSISKTKHPSDWKPRNDEPINTADMSTDEIEKLKKRSQRFGTESILLKSLNEKEKLNARASRFNINSDKRNNHITDDDTLKENSEEILKKLKNRKNRFDGIVESSLLKEAELKEKLKMRQERFSNPNH